MLEKDFSRIWCLFTRVEGLESRNFPLKIHAIRRSTCLKETTVGISLKHSMPFSVWLVLRRCYLLRFRPQRVIGLIPKVNAVWRLRYWPLKNIKAFRRMTHLEETWVEVLASKCNRTCSKKLTQSGVRGISLVWLTSRNQSQCRLVPK